MMLNERFKKLILSIPILVISIYLANKVYLEIKKSPLIFGVHVGSGNSDLILTILFLILIGLFLIYNFDNKYDLKYFGKKSLGFIFLVFEIILAAFTGLGLFVSSQLSSGANSLDLILRPIYFILISFFLFLVLEIIKEKIYSFYRPELDNP